MKLSPVFALYPLIKTINAQSSNNTVCFGTGCDTGPTSRADNYDNMYGTQSLVHMARTLMCYKHQSQKPIWKCNVSVNGVHQAFRNFGCNCHPANYDGPGATVGQDDSWHMGSNGRPINELDAQCQKLHNAYTCLDADRKNDLFVDPDANDPFLSTKCGRFTDYTFHVTDQAEVFCGPISNPDYVNGITPEEECQFAACKIEREFVLATYELLGPNPFNFQTNNAALYNVYDNASVCKKHNQNNVSPAVTCCGDFPARLPYNDLLRQCCSDGTTQSLGTCAN